MKGGRGRPGSAPAVVLCLFGPVIGFSTSALAAEPFWKEPAEGETAAEAAGFLSIADMAQDLEARFPFSGVREASGILSGSSSRGSSETRSPRNSSRKARVPG